MSALPRLATDFLQKIGIRPGEITGYFEGETTFNLSEPLETYFVNHTFITNTEFRAVSFRRCVDGMPVVGGNGGSIEFGEHGQPRAISISWQSLKRYKSFPALGMDAMMELVKSGKAFPGPLPDNAEQIDWATVKTVTIKKAWPSYFSGDSDRLYPYMAFWTSVDTGHGNVEIEIDCPIIDEAKAM
jgi:hypothetical protein